MKCALCLSAVYVILSAIVAADSDRFTLERPTPRLSAPMRIEPKPETTPPPLPEAEPPTKAAVAETVETPHVDVELPPDDRPLILFYRSDNCEHCDRLEADIEAGQLPWFRFELRDAPGWVTEFQTLHFEGKSKTGWVTSVGYVTAGQFCEAWQSANPGKRLRLPPARVAAASAGASPIDQALKFAGPAGKFTFTPDKPIRTTLDDGTAVSYPSISGRYKIEGGRPIITLEAPLPHVVVTKFGFHFGADIQGADYQPPSALNVNTTRGRYTITLEKAKR